MQFVHEPEEYAGNLNKYSELDEVIFSPSQSPDEVIGKLKEISLQKKEIAGEQNGIICEYLERFEKGEDSLDEQAAEKLYALLVSLCPDMASCLDPAVGLRLCVLLYDFYHKQGNTERGAFVMGYGTLCELLLSLDREEYDFFRFPQLCEEYFAVFGQISPEAQEKLIYAYSFRFFVKLDEGLKKLPEVFEEVEERFLSVTGQMEDQVFVKSRHVLMLLNFFSFITIMCRLDTGNRKFGKTPVYDLDIDKHRAFLEKCVNMAQDGLDYLQGDEARKVLLGLNLHIIRYFLGQLSFEEFLGKLDEAAKMDEQKEMGGMIYLTAHTLYLDYLHYCSPYDAGQDDALARQRIAEVMPRILELKKQNELQFANQILGFINATSLFGSFDDFYGAVLDFTVYADKALYVHTVMVKEICHLLLERMLEEDPGYLKGVCGWSTDHIVEHADEVLELMDQCAMCHDIGKHFIIEIVSNSSRRLTEEEFGLIKLHPQNYEIVCERDHNESPRQKCIRDCALLHHRWHNGKGGYPDIPRTENQPFADILSIADSLDAATDFIGRPYGTGKTLDDLIGEFMEMGGSRYSRRVAEILNEPEIRERVAKILTDRREEVNYLIYAKYKV